MFGFVFDFYLSLYFWFGVQGDFDKKIFDRNESKGRIHTAKKEQNK